jgi:hypothetical protein
VLAVKRSSYAERGAGNNTAYFELAGSVISAHLAEKHHLYQILMHKHIH